MNVKRRIGSEQSVTRTTILDAAKALMQEEGYAAVSARRVATQAGVKPAVIQYYFPKMLDLFLAVYRRAADHSIDRQSAALASSRPLHALWTLSSDDGFYSLAIEFMALANHHKPISAEISVYNERARELQASALRTILASTPYSEKDFPSAGISLLLAGAARALVMEGGIGINGGHDDARAIIERWLEQVEPIENC